VVIHQFVAQHLPHMRCHIAQAIHALQDIDGEVKPVDFVEHAHVKRSGDGAFGGKRLSWSLN
jgi:hypothetical protein